MAGRFEEESHIQVSTRGDSVMVIESRVTLGDILSLSYFFFLRSPNHLPILAPFRLISPVYRSVGAFSLGMSTVTNIPLRSRRVVHFLKYATFQRFVSYRSSFPAPVPVPVISVQYFDLPPGVHRLTFSCAGCFPMKYVDLKCSYSPETKAFSSLQVQSVRSRLVRKEKLRIA